jgi:hypothetical protein
MNNKSLIKEKKIKIKKDKSKNIKSKNIKSKTLKNNIKTLNKKIKIKKKSVKKNIINYELKKHYYESEFIYQIRKRFIDFYKPKNEKDFKLYEMYSNILINMVFLKCKYIPKTEKKIKDYINKEKNNIIKNLKILKNLNI